MSDDPPDQDEAALLAAITVALDGGDGPHSASVDEFAPEFLLQLDTPSAPD